MFTVIFAIPRTSGWVSQWLELKDDPEQKIARPRQIYTGQPRPGLRADRQARGPREDHRPAGAAPEAAPPRRVAAKGSRGMAWRVVERHGSEVTKGRFDTLDEALEHARDRVDAVLREGRLRTVSMLREFTPDQRVQARVEISTARFLRGTDAGIDVMGDGSVIAYRGGINREALDADTLDEAFERLRDALGG